MKEEHAEIVKREVRIIWGDYFKPEHLEKYKDLHQVTWDIMKLAGKNKQEINAGAADELLAATQKFAEMFWDSKGVEDEEGAVEPGRRRRAGGTCVRALHFLNRRIRVEADRFHSTPGVRWAASEHDAVSCLARLLSRMCAQTSSGVAICGGGGEHGAGVPRR